MDEASAIVRKRAVSEPGLSRQTSSTIVSNASFQPVENVHDSHSAYIDALLGRISPPVVNSHVPMETSPDVPSDSDRSFFQVNRAVYCSYDKPPGELFYKSSARIAVSQGKIIDSVELGSSTQRKKKSTEAHSLLEEDCPSDLGGMGQNDDRRQEGGERDRRAALEIISAEDPMSRSSRNLRDLLKPNAEDVFDCSRVDPQRGSVRGLPARKLLQRVFNWKSSTSFSVSPPIEEIADSIPIEPVSEPVSVDVPVVPLPTPKPWVRPRSRPGGPKKTDASFPRQSKVIRKVKAAAERKLSLSIRRRRRNERCGISDCASTFRFVPQRRSGDTETSCQATSEMISGQKLLPLTLPARRSRLWYSTTPTANRFTDAFEFTRNSCGTQTDATFCSTKDKGTQMEIPFSLYLDSHSDLFSFRIGVADSTDIETAETRKDDTDLLLDSVEIRPLSIEEDTYMEESPAGFASVGSPIIACHVQEDEDQCFEEDPMRLLDNLVNKINKLEPDIRIRIAVAIMQTLKPPENL